MGHHSIPEAKENLSALIDRAAAGEAVVIVRDGKPVAEIRALSPAPAHPQGTAGEMLEWLRERRVGRGKPGEDAVDTVRRMRDEDWR